MRLVIGLDAGAVGLARDVAIEPAADELAQFVGHRCIGARRWGGDRRGRGFLRFGRRRGGVLLRLGFGFNV